MWPFSSSYPVTKPQDAADHVYDYVIVGGQRQLLCWSIRRESNNTLIFAGGTAGCVLARRLSESHQASVLLIERGGVHDTWTSKVPLFSNEFLAGQVMANRQDSLPVAGMDNRCAQIITGRALGGASRVNGMMYLRGSPGEFNAWAAAGRKGWAYDDIVHLFVKSERALDEESKTYQGTNGNTSLSSTREHR
jgi:choline dehydrogenase